MIFFPLSLSHYFYLNPSLQIFWPVSVREISGKQEISSREARPVQGNPGFLTYFLLVSSHVPPFFLICTHSLTPAFTLFISLHYLSEPKPHKKMRSQVGKVASFVESCDVLSGDRFHRGPYITYTHTHTQTLDTHALCD